MSIAKIHAHREKKRPGALTTTPRSEHQRALIGLLLANLAWGVSFPLIKSVIFTHGQLLPGSGNWFITALALATPFLERIASSVRRT